MESAFSIMGFPSVVPQTTSDVSAPLGPAAKLIQVKYIFSSLEIRKCLYQSDEKSDEKKMHTGLERYEGE